MSLRQSPRHKERGLAQLAPWTWQTIADVLGVSIHTARKYGQGAGRRFDPGSPASVFRYAASRTGCICSHSQAAPASVSTTRVPEDTQAPGTTS